MSVTNVCSGLRSLQEHVENVTAECPFESKEADEACGYSCSAESKNYPEAVGAHDDFKFLDDKGTLVAGLSSDNVKVSLQT